VTPGSSEMFLPGRREFAAQINHPNVCSVLDFDEHHGTYYLANGVPARPDSHGESSTLLACGYPTRRPAWHVRDCFARIFESACGGPARRLHEAVNRLPAWLSISCHRECVAPDNLFRGPTTGNVKVMDFGVVVNTSDAHMATRHRRGQREVLVPSRPRCSPATNRIVAPTVWGLGRRRVGDAHAPEAVRQADRAGDPSSRSGRCPSRRRRRLRPGLPPDARRARPSRAWSVDREKRFPTARGSSDGSAQRISCFTHAT